MIEDSALKTFTGVSPEAIEKNFNKWMKANHADIVYAVPVANAHGWALFAFYREIPPPTREDPE